MVNLVCIKLTENRNLLKIRIERGEEGGRMVGLWVENKVGRITMFLNLYT